MQEFVLEKCKIVLNGNDILTKEEIFVSEPVSRIMKEKWLSTKYRIYQKPVNVQANLTSEEWKSILSTLHKPAENKFVPKNTQSIIKRSQSINTFPKSISFPENQMINLYHLLDHVYLKPNTVINIVFKIR